MNKTNILLISCIFGNKFKKVYKAPLSYNCYFFSNNSEIQIEVENKGWKFIFVNFKLVDDYTTCSLQSKYIKFLIFLNDFPKFKNYKQILYFDHKVFIKENHIIKLINITPKNIIIRKHESKRNTIFSEVEESKSQERYNKNMQITITFINEKINKNEISNNVEICNTGLILYNNYDEILPMLYDIYNTFVNLQQPQCQIIWSICSQKYSDKITLIDFYNIIDPIWLDPADHNDLLDFFYLLSKYKLILIVLISFILFVIYYINK